MNEGELSEIKFNDNMPTERLYRNRFVYPEGLIGLAADNNAIVELIEKEIDKRIKEKTINAYTNNEVILKNITGAFFGDLGLEERESLIKVIGEIKDDMTSSKEEKAPTSQPKNKVFTSDELKRMIKDSENSLSEEAKRAGYIAEVDRKSNGDFDLIGDTRASQARILEIEDAPQEGEEEK